ncbi:MAG: hypothetical protein IKH11_08485, partial [Bacteroidales bacterium]|nr:hypothetical protein [Bacteroidales bacterium]
IQDDTKVELTDGVKTLWCRDDRLSVFGTNGANYCFSTTDEGATAVFKAEEGQNPEDGLGSSQPFALYPWSDGNSINNSSYLTTYIAPEQYGKAGDYGSQQPVLVGRADADGRISFRHASTVLKISVESEGISRITFKSNGGEPVCGALTADSTGETVSVNGPSEVSFLPPEGDSSFSVGDYHFVIAPGTFSSGVTLSWEPAIDGLSSSKSSSGAVGALPGHLLKCGKVEYVEKAQRYEEPTFGSVDVTGKYDWYGSLTTRQKEFMLPHIQTSFINAEWFFDDLFIYVIVSEIPDFEDCENIGYPYGGSVGHANGSYSHIRPLAPLATIKSSGGQWTYFESYFLNHTELNYCVSISSDYLVGDYKNELKESSDYESLKRILGYSNVIISCAANNKTRWNNSHVSLILNEDSDEIEEGVYRSGSVNSNLNNKICVPGYDPDKKNYFGWNGDSDSCRPVGFGKDKHNIVMPMFNLNYDTASSFSTAMLSGTLGNFLSILMKTHPGTTLEGANTILQENYLREEKFKYVDETDGSIKDGGDWYFFDTDKFFENEVLHKAEVDAALAASGGDKPLPSGYGLFYTGPGIQFEAAGSRYDMTEANRATFEAVWKEDPASVKWYFNSASATASGASGSVNVQVRVLDKDARLIPDISRTVSVNL